jgi:hypothetical protein
VECSDVSAVILAVLSRRISSKTSMEHTLKKDERVDDMVILDVAWEKRDG